jgi:hypothetical protein
MKDGCDRFHNKLHALPSGFSEFNRAFLLPIGYKGLRLMPVVRVSSSATFLCALLIIVGCRSTPSDCPQAFVTAEPTTIPEGLSGTDLFVDVRIPSPVDGLVAVTELLAISGTIADPFARATTYACAHDVSGPVEVCVKTAYVESDAEGGALGEVPNVECSETDCTDVVCPEEKNVCPEVSSLTIDPMAPMVVPVGEKATITVVADDPDDNPEELVATLTARHGIIADARASETTHTCDPNVGGVIPICVEASDGACTDTVCAQVRCPGEPLENTCPIIDDMSADPNPIPRRQDSSTVVVTAFDPDEFPKALSVEWTSDGGGFEDPHEPETTFSCGEPGPVDVCLEVSDGDPSCLELPDAKRCMTIECPSDVIRNFCPNLNVINVNPSTIQPGSNWTTVQTRGWDTDGKPFPMVLTLTALWGTFEDTENMSCPEITLECPQSDNVVFQNAIYICDRPGPVELCVDATDGACTKTLCTDVVCPDDVPTPP